MARLPNDPPSASACSNASSPDEWDEYVVHKSDRYPDCKNCNTSSWRKNCSRHQRQGQDEHQIDRRSQVVSLRRVAPETRNRTLASPWVAPRFRGAATACLRIPCYKKVHRGECQNSEQKHEDHTLNTGSVERVIISMRLFPIPRGPCIHLQRHRQQHRGEGRVLHHVLHHWQRCRHFVVRHFEDQLVMHLQQHLC